MNLPAELEQEVEALERLNLEELRTVWRSRFGPPPKLRSVELLHLSLAFRLQAKDLGGLDRDTRRTLARSGPVKAEGLHLGVGAILRRDWQGQIVEVIVEENGFRCGDTVHPSLSAAATDIAGSRWNGPRFFGLRKTDRSTGS